MSERLPILPRSLYRHGYHRQSQTVCKDHQRLLCTGQRWKQQCVTLYCYYYLTETVRQTFVRPEVRHDSDAAVIPGGLTPLIQTLFGKILPHPNFAVAITNSLTQYCNRSRGYQCRIYGGGISLWSWGSVGILQKLNCFSCQLRWGGGGAAADFGGQSEWAILKLQSSHGTLTVQGP